MVRLITFFHFCFHKSDGLNLFKALYYNQYFSLKKQGKEYAARKNGNIIATVTIILYGFSIFLLLMTFIPDFDREMNRFFRKTFGRSSGKFIGQLLTLLLFGAIYPLLKFTIGSEKSFNSTIQKFSSYSKEQQQNISDKGLAFFIVSVVSIFISFIAILIKTYAF